MAEVFPVAEFTPAPVVDRQELAEVRLPVARALAGQLTTAAAAVTNQNVHLRGVMTAGGLNTCIDEIARKLAGAAWDHEFIEPLARLTELEAGAAAMIGQ